MRQNHIPDADLGGLLTGFTADVANAAYFVLLRSGVGSFWIDLQLDIWKELGEAIQTRLQQISSGRKLIENIDPGREVVLAELTDTAYRIGLRHGLQRPFLDVELELYLALNRIVERLPPRHAAADRLWRQRPGWKS